MTDANTLKEIRSVIAAFGTQIFLIAIVWLNAIWKEPDRSTLIFIASAATWFFIAPLISKAEESERYGHNG